MPRLIRIDRPGPVKITPEQITPGKTIFICGCGLTKNFPFCDGTHKSTCATEDPDKTYRYNPDGTRDELPDEA